MSTFGFVSTELDEAGSVLFYAVAISCGGTPSVATHVLPSTRDAYHLEHPDVIWVVAPGHDRSFCDGARQVFCFHTLWCAYCARARNRTPTSTLALFRRELRLGPDGCWLDEAALTARIFFQVLGGAACLFA
jgi:hypothetical protein